MNRGLALYLLTLPNKPSAATLRVGSTGELSLISSVI